MADYFNYGANGQQQNTGMMKNGQMGYFNTFADVGSPGQNGLNSTQQQNLQNYGYNGNQIATSNFATGQNPLPFGAMGGAPGANGPMPDWMVNASNADGHRATPGAMPGVQNGTPWQAQSGTSGAGSSGMGAYGGAPGGSYGAPGPANGGGNPYLDMQADGMARRMNDNMQRNILPQSRTAAMAAGGYGDNRTAVFEANLYKDMNQGLSDSYANLYGTDWTNSKNRELSRYQGDQGFYTQQRGQDLAQVGLGADLYRSGMNGEFDPIKNASQTYSPYTGLNSTTTQNQNSGGGWMGAVGGAMGAYDFYKNITK